MGRARRVGTPYSPLTGYKPKTAPRKKPLFLKSWQRRKQDLPPASPARVAHGRAGRSETGPRRDRGSGPPCIAADLSARGLEPAGGGSRGAGGTTQTLNEGGPAKSKCSRVPGGGRRAAVSDLCAVWHPPKAQQTR